MKPCAHCGEQTKNKTYCSHKCLHAGRRFEKEVQCVFCNKTYTAYARELRRAPNFFCSDLCRAAKRSKVVHKICEREGCNNKLSLPLAQANKRRHCSVKCYSLSRIKLITLTCPQCGEDFEQTPSKGRTYCSHKCASAAMRKYSNCRVCGKKTWVQELYRGVCSKSCAKQKQLKKTKECRWCSDKFKGHPGDFCSHPCSRMYRHYGDVNLTEMQFPVIEIYLKPGAEPLWLPVTSSEIEILLYLHHRNLPLTEIVKHVKRWRQARKRYRKYRKDANINVVPVI